MHKKILIIALFFVSVLADGAVVDTVYMHSVCMKKQIPAIIITPGSYTESAERFPALYMLHGAYDNYTEWVRDIPEILQYADQYNMIIVCPDAGKTSWYFDSPIDPTMRYETYITTELVSWVDAHYRTLPERGKRAITGLSMGGHGAFYLAFRHQEIWGAAGSMGGGVDFRPFPGNWEIAKRLGSYDKYPENWEKNTVINLLHLLNGKGLNIFFDCGSDDFFVDGNRRLHQLMLQRNIPHTYLERPGKHDNDYWRTTCRFQLFYFHVFFSGN